MSAVQAVLYTDVPAWDPSGSKRPLDSSDYDGAMRLAVRVRDGWYSLGYAVEVWLQRETIRKSQNLAHPGIATWTVRSDLVAGVPRRALLQGEQPLSIITRK